MCQHMSSSVNVESVYHANRDLLDVLAISYGDPRTFDAHFGVTVHPFPYIGKASRGECVISNSGEATRNDVRRWQEAVVAADGLQLVQT